MQSPTNHDIAQSYELWIEYVDRLGVMTRADYDALALADRLDLMRAAFGPEPDDTAE